MLDFLASVEDKKKEILLKTAFKIPSPTPKLFKTLLYEHPIFLPQRLQITSETLSHSILNFLHPPHGDCSILTVSIPKRLRGLYPGNPLWSKPPAFLHTSYSTSFQISVAGVSSRCTSCSQNLLMAQSYTTKFKSGAAVLSHVLQPRHVQLSSFTNTGEKGLELSVTLV